MIGPVYPCHSAVHGKRVIICHSAKPHPVWVWTAPDVTKEELERIGACLASEFPVAEGFTYNITYELLEQLKRLGGEFASLSIRTNLLSYRCDHIAELPERADGRMIQAKPEHTKALARLMHDMTYEALGRDDDMEHCLENARAKIENGELYAWLNAAGEPVAITARRPGDQYMCLSYVFTKPEERRKGYALALVHGVTKRIAEMSAVPILYTDADYAASNECYRKIGYVEVGSLCTVGK